MSNLKTREEVIERYWPDYIDMCMRTLDGEYDEFKQRPTVDGFWYWYITKGPLGVHHRNLFYNEERVTYL